MHACNGPSPLSCYVMHVAHARAGSRAVFSLDEASPQFHHRVSYAEASHSHSPLARMAAPPAHRAPRAQRGCSRATPTTEKRHERRGPPPHGCDSARASPPLAAGRADRSVAKGKGTAPSRPPCGPLSPMDRLQLGSAYLSSAPLSTWTGWGGEAGEVVLWP